MYKRTAQRHAFLACSGSEATRISRKGHHPDLAAATSQTPTVAEQFKVPELESEFRLASQATRDALAAYQALRHLPKFNGQRLQAYRDYRRAEGRQMILRQQLYTARSLASCMVFNEAIVSVTCDPSFCRQAEIEAARQALVELTAQMRETRQAWFEVHMRSQTGTARRTDDLNAIQRHMTQIMERFRTLRRNITRKDHLYGSRRPLPLDLYRRTITRCCELAPDIFGVRRRFEENLEEA